MSVRRFTCGIVVPVRDEVQALSKTVPALLAAMEGESALVVWVCNGCSDGSAELIRSLAGSMGDVLEIAAPGKTLALQAGDKRLNAEHVFPRLYLDSDTWLRPGDVGRLLAPLRAGAADLVAASHAFDYSRSSSLSAELGRCWLALPFARDAAFLGSVAVSEDGRRRWGDWPRVIADDLFMAGVVPNHRRMMVAEAIATTWSPPTFSGWVSMRTRWLRGERQIIDKLGMSLPAAPKQRVDLLLRLLAPRTSIGALAFCVARLMAVPRSRWESEVPWMPARRKQ